MDSHTFNKTILREYDIRGIVKKDLNLIDALYLGGLCEPVIIIPLSNFLEYKEK